MNRVQLLPLHKIFIQCNICYIIIFFVRIIVFFANTKRIENDGRIFRDPQVDTVQKIIFIQDSRDIAIDKQILIFLFQKDSRTSCLIKRRVWHQGECLALAKFNVVDQHDASAENVDGAIPFQSSDPVDTGNGQGQDSAVHRDLFSDSVVIQQRNILAGKVFPACSFFCIPSGGHIVLRAECRTADRDRPRRSARSQ